MTRRGELLGWVIWGSMILICLIVWAAVAIWTLT